GGAQRVAGAGVVGVSACASFAAVCAFYSGLAAAFTLALPLAGIAGAAIAVALLMSAVRAGTGTVSLLLMGVAINAIAGALIGLGRGSRPGLPRHLRPLHDPGRRRRAGRRPLARCAVAGRGNRAQPGRRDRPT